MRHLTAAFFLFIATNALGQLYSNGLVFNDLNYKKAQIRANLNSSAYLNLPARASMKKYCPKPGNQLQLNTSPSWAVTWSAQTILEAKRQNLTDQNEITQITYSPAYNYFYVRNSNDDKCESGIDLYEALNFLKSNGAEKYDQFLEFCPRGVPEEIFEINELQPISDFVKLFDDNHSDSHKTNAMKKSLSENYPVVIGMYCPPSFYHAKDFWQPKEIVSSEYPGHSLCIIGYDDEKYGGAFEVINSWGTQWANEGFTWIRYEDLLDFTKYAYEVIDINKSKSNTFNFEGTINLSLNDNSLIEMTKENNERFKTKLPLSTGTYFRIKVDNNSPAFMYVFGIDENQKLYKVFPHQDHISPALVYENNTVVIPGEENYIEIIGDPGKENLCILYSKESLDFGQLIYSLEKYPGNVRDNLDAILSGKLIELKHVSIEDGSIHFSAESKEKSAVLLQIQIDHI